MEDLLELFNEEDENSPAPFKCSLCGREDDFANYHPENEFFNIMLENNVCYQCAYWMYIIKHPPVNHEIVDGAYMEIHPQSKRPFNRIMGGLGKEFYLRRNDGSLLKSNNVHLKGIVPEHFRHILKDTACFVNLIDYQKLKNHPNKCPSKGCWERYNCLRYDMSLEKDGPFNEVPEHEVGEYRCPQFINRFKIKNQWYIS